VLVNFSSTDEQSSTFLTSGYSQSMTQVQNASVASPAQPAFVASVSPPTALSLPWGLDDYVAMLSEAVLAADAAE
jgi:iron complex transport system substrate-binding protein